MPAWNVPYSWVAPNATSEASSPRLPTVSNCRDRDRQVPGASSRASMASTSTSPSGYAIAIAFCCQVNAAS